MTTLDDLPLRDDLRGRSPYGAPQAPVPVALNVNENTHGIPEVVAHDIVGSVAASIMGLNRYPDREFSELRRDFAAYLGHGLREENIWAANGSNEVLQQILLAFGGPGRTFLGFTPTYSMYPLLATGTSTRWIGRNRQDDFELSADYVSRVIGEESPDIVVLCSPNNPTGTPLTLDTVRAAYEASPGIVIVDEAYAEFSDPGTPSALELLPGRSRLIVSRTMSKAFAFAGARVGYLAADPAIADALRLVRLPYHLSALTQAAARAALRHSDAMLAVVDDIRTQRNRISRQLAALGYRPYRSGSNFVFFGGVDDTHATFRRLFDRGILIRDVGIDGHMRVTAGTETETTAFLDAMAALRS
ncbi:histidinol-phosphate transaminase [Paramicrobacterium chengjingii]|uniref:Histidinol-phosphate aminotransferase n=1 Tax=Paramicrobacterium chengjingii TaxID=2769067 RepID=A0ABX6YED5_9MICO|nr:histidinol-phosphate transaminase [Microbacterium chengjingii]QPZ37131.1 histidinol-phosphate transaminase [Microbacterium chengjingii]